MIHENFDALRTAAEAILETIDALERLREEGFDLADSVLRFENGELQKAENDHKKNVDAAREKYRELSTAIDLQPRAKLKAMEGSRYSFLQGTEIDRLKKEIEDNPGPTFEEIERAKLAEKLISLPAERLKKLKEKAEAYNKAGESYRRKQTQLFDTLCAQSDALHDLSMDTSQHRGKHLAGANDTGIVKRVETLEQGSPVVVPARNW